MHPDAPSPKSSFLPTLLAGALGGLVVLVVGAILIATDVIETGDTRVVQSQPALTRPAADGGGRTVQDIYRREGRGVVFISAEGVSSDDSFFSPEGTATGSGFVVDDDGTILTNAHVVDGADSVSVSLREEGKSIDAEVKGVDPESDLAVLKVDPADAESEGGLVALPLGDSSKLSVGDPVVAIGNPFGSRGFRTVTTGIVSALQRSLPTLTRFQIGDVIQTDAAINPGNSGGPLLNARGEVIGINFQIATGGGEGSVGIGFAIPINTAKRLLPELREGNEIEYAYLGVRMATLTSDVADELNLDTDEGVVIAEATDGGPAAEAGLRSADPDDPSSADVIVALDGKKVTRSDDVADAVSSKKPGDTIEIDYVRDGERKSVKVKLDERPSSAGGPPDAQPPEDDRGLLP